MKKKNKKNKTFYILNISRNQNNNSYRLDNPEIERQLADFKEARIVEVVNLEPKEPKTFAKEELGELAKHLNGALVVTQIPEHRIALQHAFKQEGINNDNIEWISGARIMRRIEKVSVHPEKYTDYRENAYDTAKIANLKNETCKTFSDILLKILKEEGKDLADLYKNIKEAEILSDSPHIEREGAPNCLFTGQTLKISGDISKIIPGKRKIDAAHWAAGLGFKVIDKDNNKHTTVCIQASPKGKKEQKNGTDKVKNKKYEYLIKAKAFLELVYAPL